MTVTLAPELEQLVAEKISSGRYASVTAVLTDALHLLTERDEEHERDLAEVRAELEAAEAEMDAGLGIPGDQWLAMVKSPAVGQAE